MRGDPSRFAPRPPGVSLACAAFAIAAWASDAASAALVFDRAAVMGGEWWRLLTGSWVHFSARQLALDVMVLLLAGALVERRSPARFLAVVMAAALAAGLAVLVAEPATREYGGLSGVAVAAVTYAALVALADGALPPWIPAGVLGLLALRMARDAVVPRTFAGEGGEAIAVSVAAHAAGALSALTVFAVAAARRPRAILRA